MSAVAIWDDVIPESERWAYAGDFAQTSTRGQRPALLVIDVRLAFAHERAGPLSSTIDQWLSYWGEGFWPAIEHLKDLIRLARAAGLPVIYTEMTKEFQYPQPGIIPAATNPGPREQTVVSILPTPDDLVIRKHKNSAFFGTLLASHLISLGVDTLIACGCATSACVRATVTDAASYNYHVMVVEECTFDKRPTVHKVNLFDMNNRFGEVVSLQTVGQYLESISIRET